jgi:L-asparagine transporter-like permease
MVINVVLMLNVVINIVNYYLFPTLRHCLRWIKILAIIIIIIIMRKLYRRMLKL